MNETLPVVVMVRRSDGSSEAVQVGTAVRQGEGFSLRMGELFIGEPDGPRQAAPSAGGARRAATPRPGGDVGIFPPYGRSAGQPISGAALKDLEFYANGARRTLQDPSKQRFHEKERALLAVIEAEIARQRGEDPGPGDDDGPPPHTDADQPF